MNPALVKAAAERREIALRAQRPCTLTWNDGAAKSVLAREGVSRSQERLVEGGMIDEQSCKFHVLKSLLPAAPSIGTVFGIRGRAGVSYRLDKIARGGSNDVTWQFECVEEHA